MPLSSNASGVTVYITAMVSRVCGGRVQFDEVDHLTVESTAQVAHDLVGHADRDQTQGDRPERTALAGPGDRDVGEFTCERGVSGVFGMYEGHAFVEVQRVDDVTLALMQVHRAWMHRCGRLSRARRSQ